MSKPIVTAITKAMVLGEGPYWFQHDQSLLFVDHPGGTLNRYYTQTKRHQVFHFDNLPANVGPSVAIPTKGTDDQFVVGLGHDLGLLQWSPDGADKMTGSARSLLQFDMEHENNSLNDAKCDSEGRLWAGTKGFESKPCQIDPHLGSLYRIDGDLKAQKFVDKVTLSNGMAWSPNNKKFYFIDSPETSIYCFDFHDDGQIDNRKVLLNLSKTDLLDNYPDGMTVDVEGNLWVACYNGAKVICVDPETGKILRIIQIPSQFTTSCCFGGPDYTSLFVTSATRGMTEEQIRQMPDSGKTFEVTGLGTRGLPPNAFDLKLTTTN